jgi:hypothetical protein
MNSLDDIVDERNFSTPLVALYTVLSMLVYTRLMFYHMFSTMLLTLSK